MGRTRAAIIAGMLALCTASMTLASGFMISKMGGDLAGPTEPNAAAIFWNPAAIGATWVHFLHRQVDDSLAEPPITGQYDSAVILLNTNLEARF